MRANLRLHWCQSASAVVTATCAAAVTLLALPCCAQQPRALGLDISAWQGNISQTTWNNIRNVENRQFVFLRSSRGGTTGYYNQSNAGNNNPPGQNTLSQRYDDPYFVQNINRATTAGMYAGSYHFGRMDIIESTLNSDGIRNTGADEADHFMQMAGAFMRPGYLVPIFDLEAGISQRTGQELADFAIEFSDRIYSVYGIRPGVYIGGNYASDIQNEADSATEAELVEAFPVLWTARWPNQVDPNSIPVQTANPGDSIPSVYGPWDNAPNPAHPWHFWQYASTGRLQSFNNGGSNLDFDVARGGSEYLKDHLVPALWTSDASGDWNELAKWNSGQTPVTPVTGPGQVAPVGTQTLPTPRLPGAAGSGVTSGQNDTVILDRGTADPTITISSGTHNIRKLFVREALNITGGSLTINYDNPKYAANDPLRDPVGGQLAAQFSAPVSLGGSASMSVYNLQVDAGNTFTLGGGSLTFGQIDLVSHATTPAKIAVTGNVNFLPYESSANAAIGSSGGGLVGQFDLNGGARVLNVANGTSAIDMSINVPVVNGGLTKAGPGSLALNGANSYTGDTILQGGQLHLGNPFLADAADVYLASGTTLNLGFNGNDFVRSLYVDGVSQAKGVWGSEGSGAQFTSPLITGTGFLYVDVAPPPPPSGPGNVLDDFEVDEGHFNWNYNFSPVSQTFGLASGPGNNSEPSDRVTTEHQGMGTGSQLLDLKMTVEDPLNPAWQLRHNSGIGSAAQPGGNVQLAPTGYVGFWLKTDDAGAGTVQIAIDDPVPAGTSAIEKGQALPIIADNQWHLYQWNLEADNWVTFNAGSDGDIDATNGYVTIDSIWFTGSGDVQIYLDTVSHNPDGLLAAYIPGDYNRNGTVEETDYGVWLAQYGLSVPPGSGADGTGDGVVDMGDYIVWRWRSTGGSGGASSAAAPEPAAILLLTAASLMLAAIHRRRHPV